MIEPFQAVIAQLPSIFKSAMLVGDVVRIGAYISMLVFILIFILT